MKTTNYPGINYAGHTNTQNDKATPRPWKVETHSGFAGGIKRDCRASLIVSGYSDTVEHVRELTERALNEYAALNAIAEAAKALTVWSESDENLFADEITLRNALSTLTKLREGKE